jgi:ABC-type Fe3+ transport system permease subunit
MSEKLAGHPVLVYVTFVLPIVLLALGIVFKANVFLLILTIAWLGTAFIVLFLPVASDNGTSH